ncbi:chromate transporter [Rhodovulum imhoffii]|uniref:Chromate transporter n=1 Tax=Rhodovulum imhoffii TaxID=365340 RepID=A0A2T5BNI9_9RHOB|nr:chromate efflux transporter [Rhodovulum imhoffii]MBK5934609.1 chromate transporter [Rhodovulum imhoffii]PTN00562.1 chromate transporter [Rhodovulum imhoffii]
MTRASPNDTDMIRIFGRIGVLSFGGPAAQIALMHRELVEIRPWLREDEFLRALSFCMLLPGPEAMQLATYAGWRLRGTPGGLIAGGLFVLPGAVIILALAAIYARFGNVPMIQALFLGVQATVVVIVFQALLRLSRKALGGPVHRIVAALSFTAIFVLGVPYPLIIAAAALWGYLSAAGRAPAPLRPVPAARPLRTAAFWGGVWLAPIGGLVLFAPPVLVQMAVFFSKLAVVSIGGAYAVLAYMTQEVVLTHGWLSTSQMVDALGLAETTPGPLILVTEFVGYLAGYREGGWTLGLAGALVVLWVTFVPCFLWIFTGAPFIDRLAGMPRLSNALAAVTAAVVGVILNLSLWFALHVFFGTVRPWVAGPVSLPLPDPSTLNLAAVGLSAAAGGLLWRRLPLPLVLIVMAGLGAFVAGEV